MRLAWLAIAVFTVFFGLAAFLLYLRLDWSIDGDNNLAAAHRLLLGGPLYDRGYFYSPLAELLTVPATALPRDWALVGWAIAKLLLVAGLTAWATKDLPLPARLLAIAAVATFVGVLHDTALGNVNVVITAAIAIVAWMPDRAVAGVPLGVIVATVGKPWLLPLLVWEAAFRRRALAGTIVTAAVATAAGVVILGPQAYGAYIANVTSAPNFAPYDFNLGLTVASPVIAIAVPALSLGVLIWAIARREEDAALVAAIAAGLLVSPYIGLYSATPLLLMLGPLSRLAPRATVLFAGVAQIAVILLLPWFALAAALAATIAAEARRRGVGRSLQVTT